MRTPEAISSPRKNAVRQEPVVAQIMLITGASRSGLLDGAGGADRLPT
jgi:hypothetical protein